MKHKKDQPKDATESFERAIRRDHKYRYVMKLFVTGMTPKSQKAIENVRALCEEHLKGRYKLEVIDIYQHPNEATENQIIAAPTLIKELPTPLRKFVGDMTKTEKILAGLDLRIEERKVDE